MNKLLTHSSAAALISFLLTLPGALLLSLLMLGIEPPLGPLEPLLTVPADQPNILGSAIALGLILLLPTIAFLINLAPLMRNVRAGNSLAVYPVNVLLAVAILFFIMLFVGGIIVDQYPCWIGVPNCD